LIKNVITSKYEITDDEDLWTMRKIESELFNDLANFKILLDNDGVITETYPYYDQAKNLMYQTPIFKPTPAFEISRKDLSREVRKNISDFGKYCYPHDFVETMVNAVGKLFENLNPRYYHESVKKLLVVRFK
jgi:hypothetical protein